MAAFFHQSSDHEESLATSDMVNVGKWLKSAREQRNETIENVSRITRIGRPYLEAIEDGDISRLPEKAYTRGFVRLYASHLGLDADEAMHIIDKISQAKDDIKPSASRNAEIEPSTSNSYRKTSLLIPSILVVIIIASASGVYLFNLNSRSVQTAANKQEQPLHQMAPPPAKAENALKSPESHQKPVVVETSGNLPQKDGLILRLKAVNDCKMQITIDGSVSQEYNLSAGDLVEWKAASDFQLDLDNASSVEAELDGTPLKPFGDHGKAAHLIISKTGIRNN